MSVDVEIIPVGIAEADDMFAAWERHAVTITRVYAALAADFHMIEARRFGAEGPGWTPLADSTIADRERHGYGDHPILVRTDRLALSLTRPGIDGNDDSVFRVEPEGFFVGTKTPYAHWHQTGGSVDGRPPQRSLVDLSTADEVRWVAMIGRYLAHGEAGVVISSNAGPAGRMTGPGGR